jgi:hypothetical protein
MSMGKSQRDFGGLGLIPLITEIMNIIVIKIIAKAN